MTVTPIRKDQYPMTVSPATRKASIDKLLRSLGDDAAQVASTLDSAGIRGRRGSARCCPVALYLTAGGLPGVFVTTSSVYLPDPAAADPKADTDDFDYRTDLPTPVLNFVDQFDLGMFPAIEDETAGRP